MSDLSGPSKDTAAGDVVTITVPSEGPYGVMFSADTSGNAAVIKGFEKLPSGRFGMLQKHGGLHYGDVLFSINDNQLDVVGFDDVLAIIRDRNLLKKNFKFMASSEYYRKKSAKATSSLGGRSDNTGNSFLSTVRQTRINQDASASGNKFVEYEIGT